MNTIHIISSYSYQPNHNGVLENDCATPRKDDEWQGQDYLYLLGSSYKFFPVTRVQTKKPDTVEKKKVINSKTVLTVCALFTRE